PCPCGRPSGRCPAATRHSATILGCRLPPGRVVAAWGHRHATSSPPGATGMTTLAVVGNNVFAEIALDGSLFLAVPVAILAGLVSFFSPCVLPLVPGYLGYVTGMSGVNLEDQKRGRMFVGMSLFVLGFTIVFVLLGLVFSSAFIWLQGDGQWLTQVLGVVVILMGLVFMGGLSRLQRDHRLTYRPKAGLWGAPM